MCMLWIQAGGIADLLSAIPGGLSVSEACMWSAQVGGACGLCNP